MIRSKFCPEWAYGVFKSSNPLTPDTEAFFHDDTTCVELASGSYDLYGASAKRLYGVTVCRRTDELTAIDHNSSRAFVGLDTPPTEALVYITEIFQ